jgi:hypothetical protein
LPPVDPGLARLAQRLQAITQTGQRHPLDVRHAAVPADRQRPLQILHRLAAAAKAQQHYAHAVQGRRHEIHVALLDADRQSLAQRGERLIQLARQVMGVSEIVQGEALAGVVAQFPVDGECVGEADDGRCRLPGMELS